MSHRGANNTEHPVLICCDTEMRSVQEARRGLLLLQISPPADGDCVWCTAYQLYCRQPVTLTSRPHHSPPRRWQTTVLEPGYILTLQHPLLISSAMNVLDLSPCSSKLNTSRWWLLQWCCSAAEHDDLLSVSPSSSSSPDQCQQSARTPAHSMARLEKLQEHGSEEKYCCANKIFVTSTQQCSRYSKKVGLTPAR